MTLPKYEEIIKAFQNDGELAEQVILALNVGFWEEWDCDLLRGMLVIGFGPAELMLAAQAVPDDIDWDDDGPRRAEEVHDIENRYTVRVCVHVKNSGPVKDMDREEVQSLLAENVGSEIKLVDNNWVLEVEVV